MRLTEKQTIALDYLEDSITNEVLYGGSAGGGKSVVGSLWIISSALQYSQSRWLIGRATLKTLKETTLVTFFDVCSMLGLKADEHFKFNQQKGEIEFKNGSIVLLKDLFHYPSDPNFDSLGSLEITGAFIDECAQISHLAKQIVMSRIRYKLTEFNLIPKLLMTTNPAKNWTYTEFYKPSTQGNLPSYRQFVSALVTDNPNLSQYYIENLQKLDEPQKQRLLYGNWDYDDDPNALTTYDKIIDSFDNSHVNEDKFNKYITADIALRGSDEAVICVWYGWVLVEYKTIDISSGKEIETAIRDLKTRHSVPNSNIVVDADGVGGYLSSYIQGVHDFVNASSPLEEKQPDGKKIKPNYKYLKTQCEFKLAKRLNDNTIWLKAVKNESEKEKFSQEFGQLKQKNADKDGKLETLSKDDIKQNIGRSPDRMDAIKMRIYFDLEYKSKASTKMIYT